MNDLKPARKNILKKISLISVSLVLSNCVEDEISPQNKLVNDTIAPNIRLNGSANDTAFLNASYYDRGVTTYYDQNTNKENCNQNNNVEVTGEVDTRSPGSYVIGYLVRDKTDKPSSVVSRTVHVIENKAAFLSGPYEVAYTCTAVIRGTFTPTITAGNYSANVKPFSQNYYFDLDMMKVGDEYVKPSTFLDNHRIDVSFFSTSFDYRSSSTGTLSPSKNSFTIETIAYQYNPAVNYACKNVYTQVRLKEIKKNR